MFWLRNKKIIFSYALLSGGLHQAVCRRLKLFSEKDHYKASDFFQDWWAEVTHGVKNGGSFCEMMGPSISN